MLLYELLTGTTPLERKRLRAAAVLEVLRLIREEEPPKPSTRLSTTDELPSLAANRGLEPKKLSGLVRGELDWIVMKALEKDRNRRYETANGFASDLQRYLADEPVQACPPSATYRMKKILRRNKGPVLAALLVVLVLVGGIVGTTIGLFRAQVAEEKAQNEAWHAGQERDEANTARMAEKKAKQAESEQRKLAEKIGQEMRKHLYLAEMTLASQAADADSGLGRVGELLGNWQQTKPDSRGWEWYYLHGLCHRDLMTISAGGAGEYSAVAWSPDGTRLATTSRLAGPKVWDAATGKETVILTGGKKDYRVQGPWVAWSHDGMLLASGGGDIGITIWDAVTGRERCTLPLSLRNVGRNFSWAPKDARLAFGQGTKIAIWDANTGNEVSTATSLDQEVTTVAWSPAGMHLTSGGVNGEVKNWDLATGKQVFFQKLGARPVWVSWSPDGTRLAAADGSFISVWNAATRTKVFARECPASVVTWSPDGSRLACAGNRSDIKLLDAVSGQEVGTFRGHTSAVSSVSWNPDGTRLASASPDGTLKVWDATLRAEPLPLEGHTSPVTSVVWSPNGKQLASASEDKTVRTWDVATATQLATLAGHIDQVEFVSWNLAGTRLASAGKPLDEVGNLTVKVWDAATGDWLPPSLRGDPLVASWTPDGLRVVVLDKKGRMLHPLTGVLGSPLGSSRNPYANSWTPAGTHVAVEMTDGLKIVDAAMGQSTRLVGGHEGRVISVVWSPDGTRLATGGVDRTVKVWDAATGKEFVTLRGHTGPVSSVSWNPAGTRLASAGSTLKIWDLAAGKEILTLSAATRHGFKTVAWSPDGMRLASGTDGGSILIYDATNGYRLAGWPVRMADTVAPHEVRVQAADNDWKLLLARIEAPGAKPDDVRDQVFAYCRKHAGTPQAFHAGQWLLKKPPVVNSIGMKLVAIPPGTFVMGSPNQDPIGWARERPAHEVVITRPFYIGAYDVTVAQFKAFVEATGYKQAPTIRTDPNAIWTNPGYEQSDSHPVVCVSRIDALAFCDWLSAKEGKVYFLPTEAQWEYACRAGTQTSYFFGNDAKDLGRFAWFDANYEKRPRPVGEKEPRPHPIGQKEPNPWGLYDMNGNVLQWCVDGKRIYNSSRATDPMGPHGDGDDDGMLRGGCIIFGTETCRSAARSPCLPTHRSYAIGFRVVLLQ